MAYRYTEHGSIIRESDGACIPPDPNNRDYAALLASGAEIAPYSPSVSDAKARCLRELATRRWQATQRFVFDGVNTAADPAISVVTGTIVAMQIRIANGETPNKLWKLADNEYRLFDYEAVVVFGQAIEMHIQTCFEHEAALSGQIVAAGTIEAVEAIDIEAGWPS